MAFILCDSAPERTELAASHYDISLAYLAEQGILDNQLSYWESIRLSDEPYAPAGAMISSILERNMANILSMQNTLEREITLDEGQRIMESGAQLLGMIALSLLLRSKEFSIKKFTSSSSNDAGLAEFYPDVYTPEIACMHVSPSALRLLPPAPNPRDAWYMSPNLYLHSEQPPSPSSGTLEHHDNLTNNPLFYDTYTTLTPHLKTPVPELG